MYEMCMMWMEVDGRGSLSIATLTDNNQTEKQIIKSKYFLNH